MRQTRKPAVASPMRGLHGGGRCPAYVTEQSDPSRKGPPMTSLFQILMLLWMWRSSS
jgi:hypothetical protein